MPSQLRPRRARTPIMAGNTNAASATAMHEAFAREHRLNMTAHHWRKVRVPRERVGDGRGPKRAALKTDERGGILFSKEKGGVVQSGSEQLTISGRERQLSMRTDRKMFSSDLEELEKNTSRGA